MDDVGGGKGADLFPHGFDEVLPNGIAQLVPIVQRHVRVYALPLDVMVKPAPDMGALKSNY